jgi:hypothetical protein
VLPDLILVLVEEAANVWMVCFDIDLAGSKDVSTDCSHVTEVVKYV